MQPVFAPDRFVSEIRQTNLLNFYKVFITTFDIIGKRAKTKGSLCQLSREKVMFAVILVR